MPLETPIFYSLVDLENATQESPYSDYFSPRCKMFLVLIVWTRAFHMVQAHSKWKQIIFIVGLEPIILNYSICIV